MNSNMRFRTPVSATKKSAKSWEASPLTGEGIPIQCRRPNIQQAREPVLELFELSPEINRYADDTDSPLNVKGRQKYSSRDELLDKSHAEPNQHRAAVTQRPLTMFGLFSLMVLSVASLHLVNFGNHSFEGIHSHSGRSGKNIFLSDKVSFLRSNHRVLARVPPRTIFMEKPAENVDPSIPRSLGRKVVLYPAEFSDVTQLYGLQSSDDAAVAGSIERKFFPMHETNADCVPMSQWQTMSFPTCNSVHEMGILPSLKDDSLRLLSSEGNWRDAWRFKAYVARPSNEKQILDNVILKTMKLKHTLQDRYFEFSRVDALAMERLTSSPYIMDIHGFCGVSVITERGASDIAHVVNHISSRTKVDLAGNVAKSIAAVHEIDGQGNAVALVHNDINLGNIFTDRKSNPLLNDFNIAVLMMKDNSTNQSCSFPGHFPNPQWKAPEEQVGPDGNAIGELNEKVDIYALGNLLFRFATGKDAWGEMASGKGAKLTADQKKRIAYLKVDKGKIPAVPERTLELKDPYIDLLLEAMEWCYQFEPEERPTAREVAEFLETSKKELDQNLVDFGRFPKYG